MALAQPLQMVLKLSVCLAVCVWFIMAVPASWPIQVRKSRKATQPPRCYCRVDRRLSSLQQLRCWSVSKACCYHFKLSPWSLLCCDMLRCYRNVVALSNCCWQNRSILHAKGLCQLPVLQPSCVSLLCAVSSAPVCQEAAAQQVPKAMMVKLASFAEHAKM